MSYISLTIDITRALLSMPDFYWTLECQQCYTSVKEVLFAHVLFVYPLFVYVLVDFSIIQYYCPCKSLFKKCCQFLRQKSHLSPLKKLYVTDWFWSFLVFLLEPIWNFAPLLNHLKTALALRSIRITAQDQSELTNFLCVLVRSASYLLPFWFHLRVWSIFVVKFWCL